MTRAFVFAALLGCSPATRLALHRCPTMITGFADFAAGSTLLGMSVLAYNADRDTRAFTFAVSGMVLFVAAGVAECKR